MRNAKLLVFLAVLLIGTLGVVFVGCEGDQTTINEPQPPDRVIGSAHGVVADAFDNTPLAGVEVTWVSSGDTHTVVTDTKGIYVTDDILVSGEYVFIYSVAGYAIARVPVAIPTVEELRGEPGTPVSGDIPWSEETNVDLPPINATVTGKVYTALPAPKIDNLDPVATGDSTDLVIPVPGIEVHLEYDWDISPWTYITFTDANGVYTFMPQGNVPWVGSGVQVRVPPFAYGDSSYMEVVRTVNMVHNGTATVPNIYAPLDCGDSAEILRTNFDNLTRFHYDSLLRFTFSEPMDTLATVVTIHPDTGAAFNPTVDTPWTFTAVWSIDDQILEIDPYQTLLTDRVWVVYITFKSRDGCPTQGRDTSIVFRTKDGIKLLTTNLAGPLGDYREFPITSPIELTFNMPPNYLPALDTITLFDITELGTTGDTFAVDFSVSTSGNMLIVTPSDSLERNHNYRFCYRVSSFIEGDYANGCFTFWSEVADVPPPAPTAFAIDMGLQPDFPWPPDWNSTTFVFRWNTVQQADSFKIFAKDNQANSDFIQIDAVAAADFLQYQIDTVVLPAQFDFYQNDGIQTPFSNGKQVTFGVLALNSAGVSPFSNLVTLADSVAPEFNIVQDDGSADNVPGASGAFVTLTMDRTVEYVRTTNNPVISFIEGGGDETYALSPGDVNWEWNNAYRKDTTGTQITVPAGMCGAGDTLVVTIYDNSGNAYTDMIRLQPYIEITDPTSATTDFEGPNYDVSIDVTDDVSGASIGMTDYFLSLDGGVTFVDTVSPFRSGDGFKNVEVDDTLFSDNARIGIMDQDGGCMWLSEVFTYNGLIITGPDSTVYADSTPIYDARGTDSTMIPMSWDFLGIDEVEIWYWDSFDARWHYHATIQNTGTYDFYPPDSGHDYSCRLYVGDADDGRPRDTTSWMFDVTHDYVDIYFPGSSTDLEGGADTTIGWDYVGEPTQNVIIQYSVDDGTTWMEIATTANDGSHLWSIDSNTPTNGGTGQLRIRDSNDLNTLDSSISLRISGVTVTAPNGGEHWLVGSAHAITWDAENVAGGIGPVNIFLSINDWVTIDTIAMNEANDGTYDWSVSNRPSTNARIRIEGTTHNVVDESDDPFTICGVTVTSPNGGENLAVNGNHTVTWTTVGQTECSIDNVDIEYSVDGGPWQSEATVPNTGNYSWTVPNEPSTNVRLRISKAGVPTSADVSDNPFTISGIVITDPNGAENLTVKTGGTHLITWSKIGVVGTVMIQYSYTGTGGTWYLCQGVGGGGAGAVDPADESFAWDLDAANDVNLAALTPGTYNNFYIRIKEVAGPIEDLSDAAFNVTVSGLEITQPNGGEGWDAGTGFSGNITWINTGTVLTAMIEYSYNGPGGPWYLCQKAGGGDASAVNPADESFWWDLDPANDSNLPSPGTYNNFYIRIKEVAGPIQDLSDGAFTITVNP